MDKLVRIIFILSLLLSCDFCARQFFPYGPLHNDNSFTDSTQSFIELNLFKDIGLSCGNVRILRVYADGRATIAPSSQPNSPSLIFNVFRVDEGDVSIRNIFYRYVPIDSIQRNDFAVAYDQFFPRERLQRSFTPTSILVVTWQIAENLVSSTGVIGENNTFQLALGDQGNRSLVKYLYQRINWGTSVASVNLQSCSGGFWQPSTTMTGMTASTGSNLALGNGRQGVWLLYIPENGIVTPAVICRSGCSLTTGYCTEPNTCTCTNSSWTGVNCTTPVCSQGCFNGNCLSPDQCICNSGWSGSSCNEPLCHEDCLIGGWCYLPYNCTCRSGWGGANCTTPNCTNPCDARYGVCVRPDVCQCVLGWSGSTCSNSICQESCNNGNCTAPDTCSCNTGWMGAFCNETLLPDDATSTSSLSGGSTCIPSLSPTITSTTTATIMSTSESIYVVSSLVAVIVIISVLLLLSLSLFCVLYHRKTGNTANENKEDGTVQQFFSATNEAYGRTPSFNVQECKPPLDYEMNN